MKMTRLGKKLGMVLATNEVTQKEFALSIGLSEASVVRLRSKEMRPGPETLEKLCSSPLIERPDSVDLLCDHLRDEIDRAGVLQTEVEIRGKGMAHSPELISRYLDVLGETAGKRTDMFALLKDLATICESLVETDAPSMLKVAEPPASYGTDGEG